MLLVLLNNRVWCYITYELNLFVVCRSPEEDGSRKCFIQAFGREICYNSSGLQFNFLTDSDPHARHRCLGLLVFLFQEI